MRKGNHFSVIIRILLISSFSVLVVKLTSSQKVYKTWVLDWKQSLASYACTHKCSKELTHKSET